MYVIIALNTFYVIDVGHTCTILGRM